MSLTTTPICMSSHTICLAERLNLLGRLLEEERRPSRDEIGCGLASYHAAAQLWWMKDSENSPRFMHVMSDTPSRAQCCKTSTSGWSASAAAHEYEKRLALRL